MELYFSPLSCSMATRIALYEAGAEARFNQVHNRDKRLADGSDFLAINPMGQVPVLRTDEGELLTQNPVVLQYVADSYPQAALIPASGAERYHVQQWLNFVTSELHKLVFNPLLDPRSNDGAKTYARDKAKQRFDYLAAHLDRRAYLLDRFTVADAYLVVVLNWAAFAGIDLAQWPAVNEYFQRLRERPSVAKAFAEELALFKQEQSRRAA
jgi:glutathione S-transferase